MNNLTEITICMVLYDESEEIILKTLEKIKNFKIIIIDNKGDKKLKKKITSKFNISTYYLSNTNLGFSKGFNKAISFCETRFAFINKLGTWDYYTANLTKTENQTYRQDTYEQEFVNYSTTDGSVSFDKARRGTTIYNKAIQKNFGAQTDWLTTEESEWLLELFQSPSVYIQYEGGFVPIIITNTAVEKKTNPRAQKLFTYRIQYQYANKPKSRR